MDREDRSRYRQHRLGARQRGDFTLESGTWFFHQHSPEWQPDGSLLPYDNGPQQ
jgi:hypothetical protein